MAIVETQLAATGVYINGEEFTLADVVLGLSLNRWTMTPIIRPEFPHLDNYRQRLAQREGFRRYGANGIP